MKKVIKRLVVGAWQWLVPKSARNSLRLWLMLDMPDRAPQLITDFSERSVLVLAPHMDDEIIGPGGAVIRHMQSGANVTFVFMTDGLAGDPELAGANLSKSEIDHRTLEYAQTRKDESRHAAEIVGVGDLRFLDGPDGGLSDTPQLVAALLKIIQERKASLIYLPALTDNHRDHWGTNRILRQVLEQLPMNDRQPLLIRGYEVWTPLPANRIVEITSVMETKQSAVNAFVSQTRLVDYSRTVTGLNQYRAMMHFFGKGFAEAFLETTSEEYCRLFDLIGVNHRHSDS